jgi:hypothetical protein
MNCRSFAVLTVTFSVFSCIQVYGHRPIDADQTPDRADAALTIARPDVSQVYYGALETERPQVWFRFEGRKNQQIYFSVGVPVIDRLEDYRPSVALIGPGLDGQGLEPVDLPFEVPDNLGVEVFTSDGTPRFFHEHFTGTESWIHIEVNRTLHRDGIYYLVAYTPDGPRPGDKLWLSMGTKERFKLRDLCTFRRWKREIRKFHER